MSSNNVTMAQFHAVLNRYVSYKQKDSGLVQLNHNVNTAAQKIFSDNSQKIWFKAPDFNSKTPSFGGVIVQSKVDWDRKNEKGDFFPIDPMEGYKQNGEIVSGEAKVSDSTQTLYEELNKAVSSRLPFTKSTTNTLPIKYEFQNIKNHWKVPLPQREAEEKKL